MAQLSIDNALWPRGYKKKNYIVPLKSKWSGKQENGRKYVKNASMFLKIIK